jgi:hypothetical protein
MRLFAPGRGCVSLRVQRHAVLTARRRGRLVAVRVYVFMARSGKRLTGTKCGQAKHEQPS